MKIRFFLIALLVLPGCSKREQPPAPFALVKAGYEGRLADAKDNYLRDTTKAQTLATYAAMALESLRFDRETTQKADRNKVRLPQLLVDIAGRLERAVGRDTSSAQLCAVLAGAYAERLRRMAIERWYGLTSYNYSTWLREVSAWDSSVNRARLDQIIRCLRRNIETDPTLSESRYDLVRLLVARDRQVEPARKMLEQRLEKSPEDGRAWYYLGLTYSDFMMWETPNTEAHQIDQALVYFARARKYQIHDVSELMDLASQLDHSFVIAGLGSHSLYRERVAGRVPSVAQGTFSVGTEILKSTGESRWIDLLNTALKLNPYCTDALYNLMWLKFKNGDFEQSLVCYERSSEIDSMALPDHPRSFGRTSVSERAFFEKVVERWPADIRAHASLGLGYLPLYYSWRYARGRDFDPGYLANMVRILEVATIAAPLSPGPSANLAHMLALRGWRQGFAPDANGWYEKAESVAACADRLLKDGQLWYQHTLMVQAATYTEIALNDYRRKDFKKASRSLDKATELILQPRLAEDLKLRDHVTQYLIQIGRLYGQLKQPDKALTVLKKAMDFGPPKWAEAYALANLGRAYKDLGMTQEGEKLYEKVDKDFAVTSLGVWAHSDLGEVFAAVGEWSRAKRHFERLDVQSLYTLSELGIAAARLGDTAQAQSIGRRLEHSKNGGLVYNHACIAALLGNKQEAVSLLRRYLEDHKYALWGSIREDADFEPLWDYSPFQDLMRPKD